MKKTIGLLLCGLMLCSMIGCSKTPATNTGAAPTPLSYDKEIVTQADFAVIYQDAGSLEKDAELIVRGKVLEAIPFSHVTDDLTLPYTIYKTEVLQVLKGSTAVGDIVYLAQYGGVVTAEEAGLAKKFPDMTPEEKQQRLFYSFGAPLSQAGDEILAFADAKQVNQILAFEQPYFMLVGDFMGKLVSAGTASTFDRAAVSALPAIQALQIPRDRVESNQLTEAK